MSNWLKKFYASNAKEALLSSPITTSEAKYREVRNEGEGR
jgi:hypothetical protein